MLISHSQILREKYPHSKTFNNIRNTVEFQRYANVKTTGKVQVWHLAKLTPHKNKNIYSKPILVVSNTFETNNSNFWLSAVVTIQIC